MNRKAIYIIILSALVLVVAGISRKLIRNHIPSHAVQQNEYPDIFPDYKEIVIPVNMAPLNFRINDNAKSAVVVFTNNEDDKIIVRSKSKKIRIPLRKWRSFLKKTAHGDYRVEIYARNEGRQWVRFKSWTNHVVADKIDSYIAFRHINAGYILWEKMGIYQRNLESFRQTPVLLNDRTDRNCMHCHTFCNGDPQKMLLHLRRPPSGTLIADKGEVRFFNTATKYTMSACVYPSWHPDGDLIAFSVNIIHQKFQAAGKFINSVNDAASDIVVYNVEKNMLTTTADLSTKSLETLPVWSHDGRYLYYISCTGAEKTTPDTSIKYDLLRIAYNKSDGTWGQADTLLSSGETGKSISFPELSPDGRYLIFCMSDYGYFTIYSPTSDLYIMRLDSMQYEKLPVNSEYVESFHSWSSNSKWFLFVSKRLDGLYSRVFFSYIDSTGKASKPFLLPQKDPGYYDAHVLNFNRPVFIKDKVSIPADKLTKAAYAGTKNVTFDPDVDVDALSGATRIERDVSKEHTN
ncbi:MAG: PD40 domain-containing protein [Bacteroidales bacterium]|nr:PD40 domain-containing protein [Bacteroidales bacterium]